ncbi:unnamed protein product [Sordaria macrospora k-hell]|uniref:WGS project CABT00000000 data, contig 2.11 n=1 Tax=Sordaria macrospora (strain ATCC MYA-333 / DSM 997 / K(L3346) / K-hell) TaxID=771870 RepID=F7VXE0_SORMK|nr:uncharacterized protein SMAC_02760 [Sordaria macrospora k-hell]CCC10182.1 unnamed protein product [Sordaria macrospora k-hell]
MIWSPFFSLALLCFGTVARAAVITVNWNVTWVWASPDGFGRPVIGIDNQWPCPKLEATVGDTLIVNLHNGLGNQTTGLHWHGINQLQTPEMDGPSGVVQCPTPPGSTVQYKFLLDEPGTFWYHSHEKGQYPDGLRGPLIVQDPNDPYKGKYDEEIVLTVSDWYHQQSIPLVQSMLNPSNTRFAPPLPDTILVNDKKDVKFNFVKGKTYRVRLINMSAFASAFLWIDSHPLTMIMSDATYIQTETAYHLHASSAQRYDFLISAIDRDSGNYPILLALDINRDFRNATLAPNFPHNQTAWLVMDENAPFTRLTNNIDVWRPADDTHFKPLDNLAMIPSYDHLVQFDFRFCRDANGYPRACFNGKPFIGQKVPSLYTAATLVINNQDAGTHPFHLHGHRFQILDRARPYAGDWPGRDVNYISTPNRRDTVTVWSWSHAVLRFRATNPGVWLFHCHVEWHVEMGLTATFIEGPEELRGHQFPADHLENCRIGGVPTRGNAVGNTVNPLDTTGMLTISPTVYTGATWIPPAGNTTTPARDGSISSPARRRAASRLQGRDAVFGDSELMI